jgi:hypothetical protein
MRSLAVAVCCRTAVCRSAFVASITLVGALVALPAFGQTVDVALNVRYTVAGDANSGGTWRLVAKSSPTTFGIAGMQIRLTEESILGNPSPAGPSGKVNGNIDAGFSIFENLLFGGDELIVVGQYPRLEPLAAGQEQSIFYGAGTLANGAPDFPGKPAGTNSIGPVFSTLSNTARIPWATELESLGDPLWSTAVSLATGAFAPGSTPGIVGGAAEVYTSLGTSSIVGNTANISGTNFVSHGLRLIEGIGGDYNGNGIVDAADYSVWRDHLGQAFQLLNEGPDTPGEVTAEDYDFWKANFGLGSPGSASGGTTGGPGSLSVPEPGSLVLLLGAGGMLLLRPKTRAFPHVFASVKKETINVETA